jgi:hypothetical protein
MSNHQKRLQSIIDNWINGNFYDMARLIDDYGTYNLIGDIQELALLDQQQTLNMIKIYFRKIAK